MTDRTWTPEDVAAYRLRSRAEQGLPSTVVDDRVLDRLAAIARLVSMDVETSTSPAGRACPGGVEISAARPAERGTAANRAAENTLAHQGDDVDLAADLERRAS